VLAAEILCLPPLKTSSGSTPKLSVELHCGSVSTTQAEYPSDAKAAAVEMVLLVFPQPPFWLAKTMTWVSRNLMFKTLARKKFDDVTRGVFRIFRSTGAPGKTQNDVTAPGWAGPPEHRRSPR
jgi:hypothetical protein